MTTETQDEPCAYCDSDTGIYDLARDCCATRFLVNAPDKEIRDRQTAWLRNKIGDERMVMISEQLEVAFEQRRRKIFETFGGKNHDQ